MQIGVDVTWTVNYNGTAASGDGLAFNTETKGFEQFTGYVTLGMFDPVPADVHLPAGSLLDFECAEDFTRTEWYYDGAGGLLPLVVTPNCAECGWTPPPPDPGNLTCNLGVASLSQGGTPVVFSLTATLSGTANGPLRYSLDGGEEQASATFENVAPGARTVRIRDTGLAGCERTATLTVVSGVPAGPPAGIDFVGQPLWYAPPVAEPGAEVLLELWAETRHGAGDFRMVMDLRRRRDAAGRTSFRLDPLLAPLLSAFVPPAEATGTVRCTTQLVDYFVRTATLPDEGLPTSFFTGPRRTALRGALPAEHWGFDYFAYRLEVQGQPLFLSWQNLVLAKEITLQQPEWLFWLAPANMPADAVVRRSYFAPDVLGAVVVEEVVDLSGSRLVAIPVKPVAGKLTMSLSLLTAEGEPLSPNVNYTIVPATERSRYLLFTNSLGGLDCLRTEGRLESALEASAEQVELPALPPAAGPGSWPAAERQTFEISASRKLKLATGWLTAEQLRWLQELVLSREVWQWKAGKLLPLDWRKRQLLYESDTDPLRGVLLEFDYAYTPAAYAAL
jgi:hypothetical protein